VINYIWKAEIQGKRLIERGERCIHFHITTNKFIPWQKIQTKWNSLQKAHGIIPDESNPNGTDVHSVVKENKIIGYMAKYITKVPLKKDYPGITDDLFKRMFVTCKVWGQNHELSQMKSTYREEDSSNFSTDVSYFLDTLKAEEIDGEHCTVYLHKLSLEQPYPEQITNALKVNYQLFLRGDDGKKKYTID
jgi:hypothetical protein